MTRQNQSTNLWKNFVVMTFLSMMSVAVSSNAAPTYGVGEIDYVFTDATRARTLSTHVWYPVDRKAKAIPIIGKTGAIFIPVIAAKNAPFAKVPGKGFPVILLSHGSGGTAEKLFWITDYLVKHGMIVIGVDHPGNMTGDNNVDGLVQIWQRPKDLSFALDQIAQQSEFAGKIDLNKVGVVGHSAGGTTSLLMGGAKLSHSKFSSPIPKCAGSKEPYYAKMCNDVKDINFKTYAKETVEADYSDKRVKAIVGLDPGYAASFDPETLKAISDRALVFVAARLNAPQDEINSKDFLNLLPAASVKLVPNSFHMTFIQACKPKYPKDDPELAELCIENAKKLSIQKKVVAEIFEFFAKKLPK